MVFSPELPECCFGRAIAIRCNSQDIIEEARCLWAAESKTSGDWRVSEVWGCVGLLPNPSSTQLPSSQLRRWRDFVSECEARRSNYRTLAAANAGVDRDGFLKICWPETDTGASLPFDALLATATSPTRNASGFPSPRAIAAKWKTPCGKRQVSYYWNNRKHGICTYQDKDVAIHLQDPDRPC